jgi:ABC-type lipoprotein export system ATPase subunit
MSILQPEPRSTIPEQYRQLASPSPARTESILLRDVIKTFKTAAGETTVLKGINIGVHPGEFISIVGKSGSGKSTLLNMITGIDHPTSGQVLVGDMDIYKMSESQRALWRGRNLGIVFQFFQLLPMLTLLENTMLPMDYCRVYQPDERPERAMQLLRMVGLEEHAYELPAAVSTGEQQSAAIARALATDPPIIVADEPTGNLDSRSADVIIKLFDQLVEQDKTVLIVTHDPSLTKRTDRNLIVSDGEIIDETVASALPLLNHTQMLRATHLIQRKIYSPGESILKEGQAVNHLFMIARGEVEIVLTDKQRQEFPVASLGTGQFFGEVELLSGGESIASVRAAPEGEVELVILPREDFQELLVGSPLTQEVMSRIVQARLAENRSRSTD